MCNHELEPGCGLSAGGVQLGTWNPPPPHPRDQRNIGTEMWCKHCGVLVPYHEKTFATNHIKGSVECSFSLTGLMDAKNRQKMNPASRATAVAMFCDSDVLG